MNSDQITAFLQEHWNWVTLIIGAVLLIGVVMNWNWLCHPTGKPDSHRYGRGSRRVDVYKRQGLAFLRFCMVIISP